jgi:polyhydroxybutyrate depolymerase
MVWKIDGVPREALVWIPNEDEVAPAVFVFHGHGGRMGGVARKFAYHQIWPEAVVIYMQGLPTPIKQFDPKGKRSGWQIASGDQSDRDLKFFDEVYASLSDRIDPERVYCTGHSNGGRFTYLLLKKADPVPVMHVAGRKDPRYAEQQRAMEEVRVVNQCLPDGDSWFSGAGMNGVLYRSETGAPFISLIHDGGHKLPSEALHLIAHFLKESVRGGKGGGRTIPSYSQEGGKRPGSGTESIQGKSFKDKGRAPTEEMMNQLKEEHRGIKMAFVGDWSKRVKGQKCEVLKFHIYHKNEVVYPDYKVRLTVSLEDRNGKVYFGRIITNAPDLPLGYTGESDLEFYIPHGDIQRPKLKTFVLQYGVRHNNMFVPVADLFEGVDSVDEIVQKSVDRVKIHKGQFSSWYVP